MNKNFAAMVLLFLVSMPVSVLATEGALEINQACVADGCFPGDSAGFPITIANHGNYVFTSNLTVENLTDTAILVNSDNVTVDLKGFGIFGSNVCTGVQEECTSTVHDGYGVLSRGHRNITVKSGIIRGMGWIGIKLGEQSTVEGIVTEHNLWAGISVGAGSTIRNSNSNFSGFFGMEAQQSRVIDCSVADNGQVGFLVSRSIVTRVVAQRAGTWAGLQDNYGSQVHDSLFRNNVLGINSKNGGTSIFNSTMISNSSQGIFANGDTAQDPAGIPVLLSGNTIILNNGGNDKDQLGGGGTFVELGTNYCGTNTTCP